MDLEALKVELQNFPGVTRKHMIKHIIDHFPAVGIPENSGKVLAAWGEDAAVLDLNGPQLLLLAADGIMKKLMEADPLWAGYCSVLVNIHDIISMGGLPVAMVNIISTSREKGADEVLEGIKMAVEKFGVPIVGGHTHPDDDENDISVAILGTVERDHVLYSHTARPGEDIIVALDLDGKAHPVFEYSWDTTRNKSAGQVWKQMNAVRKIAALDLATACKDISNPGIIGTLGMMIESSGAGAVVELKSIPLPPDIGLVRWLKMYQGMGFVLTAKPENTERLLEIFDEVGLSTACIGRITDDNTLIIREGAESAVVFDFSTDSITGVKPAT